MFLILVARAPAPVWEVTRTSARDDPQPGEDAAFVNHYSFHIMDPTLGHLTIKMSGHPPFGAQVILNGHEYVACQARAAGIRFAKEGNCFTRIDDPAAPGSGRRHLVPARDYRAPEPGLRPVDLHRLPVFRSGPGRADAAAGSATPTRSTRLEYSRNLIFAVRRGRWNGCSTPVVDRTRSRLDVPRLRTLFGVGATAPAATVTTCRLGWQS